jgi:hypothetical protein
MIGLLIKSIIQHFIVLLLVVLPLISLGQTTIVNFDFNSATAYPALPAATATGLNAAASSSEAFAIGTGIGTGTSAFTANAAGPALVMNSSSGTNTKYFQFSLDGPSLPKYSTFKIYLQGYRSGTGATTLTLQYSVNGGSYTSFGSAYAPGNAVFTEGGYDLSGLSALNAPTSLTFRLLASGASGSGSLRVDNFQVQAVNTVDPLITSLAPSTIEAGSADFALAVAGSAFKPGAVVSFNGQNLATTYNSSASLLATVPAAAITTAGSYPIVVTNPGGIASPAATFSVTPALVHWTGAAGSTSWFDLANWSTGALPTTTDEVVLDHRYVAGSFIVSLDQNVAVSIKSLTVNPGAGDSIFALVPAGNTQTTALALSNTAAGTVALAIYNKGVVTNASGAGSGSGIDVLGTSATAFIYSGGSYRHATVRSHTAVVENLSAVAGTELGIFDFRLPTNGTASYALSLSGRIYGTLVLRNRPGQAATSFTGAGTTLTIQGNLVIGPGVTFAPAINNDLRVAGDIRAQGIFQFKETSPASPTSQVVLMGTKLQAISGTFQLSGGVGLAINNPAGATLATTVTLGGPLTLTNGILTTTAANLLTLSPTASIAGGSPTSYVIGPLVRQTNAGPLTGLVFPTGSSASYRPITLNATAQDATTYLVTQTEGPAPDYTNLPASTSALFQLTRVSRARSYTITPTPAANNFSGTVTLPFGPDDQVNAPNDASFVIGKNSGSGWQNIGNSAVSVTTAAPMGGYASGTLTSGTFTSFSNFALASTSSDAAVNPLPVTLTSFAARRLAAHVHLNWATASEVHHARFEVQRSADGQVFSAVASVAGHGTTALAHQYTALDPTAPNTLLYYRLAQVDTDGHTTFSPVVVLATTTAAVLYPNPTRDQLVVPAPAGAQVRVLDLMGRVLQTATLPPSGEVSVASLPAGTYLLQLNEGAQTLRFSKE